MAKKKKKAPRTKVKKLVPYKERYGASQELHIFASNIAIVGAKLIEEHPEDFLCEHGHINFFEVFFTASEMVMEQMEHDECEEV